jgi:hypothetical protein
MTTLILIILPTMFGILFFYLGMYQERIGWNKLIEKGTLPKPIQEGKTKSNTKPFTGKGRQVPPPFHSETRTMTQTAVEWQFEQCRANDQVANVHQNQGVAIGCRLGHLVCA